MRNYVWGVLATMCLSVGCGAAEEGVGPEKASPVAGGEQSNDAELSTTKEALNSAMGCSTEPSGNGYWFDCSGNQNVYRPWVSVTCWTGRWSRTSKYTYPGTMYSPWSFRHFQDCGSDEVRGASWGHQ